LGLSAATNSSLAMLWIDTGLTRIIDVCRYRAAIYENSRGDLRRS
jgi:hypothetical protein